MQRSVEILSINKKHAAEAFPVVSQEQRFTAHYLSSKESAGDSPSRQMNQICKLKKLARTKVIWGLVGIAGHRHRGRCRRHRHSGIMYLSPVQKHSGTGLYPLIPVPNWFRHRCFCHSGTGLIRCRTVRHSVIDEKESPERPHCKLKVVESDLPCRSTDGCCWCY